MIAIVSRPRCYANYGVGDSSVIQLIANGQEKQLDDAAGMWVI
jgi:hypothetical protein